MESVQNIYKQEAAQNGNANTKEKGLKKNKNHLIYYGYLQTINRGYKLAPELQRKK